MIVFPGDHDRRWSWHIVGVLGALQPGALLLPPAATANNFVRLHVPACPSGGTGNHPALPDAGEPGSSASTPVPPDDRLPPRFALPPFAASLKHLRSTTSIPPGPLKPAAHGRRQHSRIGAFFDVILLPQALPGIISIAGLHCYYLALRRGTCSPLVLVNRKDLLAHT